MPVVTPPLTASGYPLLKRGDTDKDVMLAQGALGLSKDGQFGPGTETTLKSWQSRNGVACHQQLDNATWTKMVQLGLVPSRNGGSTTTTSPLSAYVNTVLQRGSKGAAVVALQKALGITADGSFGPGTETKVKAYQSSKGITPDRRRRHVDVARAHGHGDHGAPTATRSPSSPRSCSSAAPRARPSSPCRRRSGSRPTAPSARAPRPRSSPTRSPRASAPTGVVAASTWAALMGQSSTGTPPTTTTPPPTQSATRRRSSRPTSRPSAGRVPRAPPSRCSRPAWAASRSTASFGPATAARVIAFQKSVGSAATGVVDRPPGTGSSSRSTRCYPYWNTVAKRGSTGANVVALQRRCASRADGSFGPGTETAVKAAQTRAKLATTGVVATLTWKAIEKQM